MGAQKLGRPHIGPGGMLIHAEIRIGDSVIYLADEADNTSDAIAPPQPTAGCRHGHEVAAKPADR